jgi:hypothetical protein
MNIKFQRFSTIFEGKILPLENQFFDTPVLFLIFNRPDVTERVFGQIRKVQPKQLFIGADGPRADKPGEKEKCEATRQLVLDMIDWDCEVKTLFRDENLGCGLAVSQAITWFFEHVEMGIILEDDCYPSIAFFKYIEINLILFKDSLDVYHISGSSPYLRKRYYLENMVSKYSNVWGWGTWKRAWDIFEYKRISFEHSLFIKYNLSFTQTEITHWENQAKALKNKRINSWAYRWQFCIWENGKYSIFPNLNLVSNIGFGTESTHTNSTESPLANRKILHGSIDEKLQLIPTKLRFKIEDDQFHGFYHLKQPLIKEIRSRIRSLLNKAVK